MNNQFYQTIRQIIIDSKQKVAKTINFAMIEIYWLVGKHIVEEEQNGKHRSEYGKEQMKQLAENLKKEFGSGFDRSNLLRMKNFYLIFPIRDTLCHELSYKICFSNS